ncbi:MAG: pyridoxal 5'-phosphate synthase glutaminase subunit PdxT [Candidatus Acidiferrales bacterium]
MTVGILAVQGDFEAHAGALERLGAEPRFVRRASELTEIDALILPGGESTTMLKFLEQENFLDALRRLPAEGKPLFGTCAGAILLAKDVGNPPQASLGLMDISVERNAYGRQVQSAVRAGKTSLKDAPLEMVFIRAPIIRRLGAGVKVLAECDGLPVAVEESGCLATTFHPELTTDSTLHEHFLRMVAQRPASAELSARRR